MVNVAVELPASSKSGCIWHSSKMALLGRLPECNCGTLLKKERAFSLWVDILSWFAISQWISIGKRKVQKQPGLLGKEGMREGLSYHH